MEGTLWALYFLQLSSQRLIIFFPVWKDRITVFILLEHTLKLSIIDINLKVIIFHIRQIELNDLSYYGTYYFCNRVCFPPMCSLSVKMSLSQICVEWLIPPPRRKRSGWSCYPPSPAVATVWSRSLSVLGRRRFKLIIASLRHHHPCFSPLLVIFQEIEHVLPSLFILEWFLLCLVLSLFHNMYHFGCCYIFLKKQASVRICADSRGLWAMKYTTTVGSPSSSKEKKNMSALARICHACVEMSADLSVGAMAR